MFKDEDKTKQEIKPTWVAASCQSFCCGSVSLFSMEPAGRGSLCRRPCGGRRDTSIFRRSKQTTGTLGLAESLWTSPLLLKQDSYYYFHDLCTGRCLNCYTPVVAVSWQPALGLTIDLFIHISKTMIYKRERWRTPFHKLFFLRVSLNCKVKNHLQHLALSYRRGEDTGGSGATPCQTRFPWQHRARHLMLSSVWDPHSHTDNNTHKTICLNFFNRETVLFFKFHFKNRGQIAKSPLVPHQALNYFYIFSCSP